MNRLSSDAIRVKQHVYRNEKGFRIGFKHLVETKANGVNIKSSPCVKKCFRVRASTSCNLSRFLSSSLNIYSVFHI